MEKKNFFEKLILGSIISLFLINIGIWIFAISINNCIHKQENYSSNVEYIKDKYVERLESDFNSAREVLADEVDRYMDSVAPKSIINSLTLIDMSSKYNVDLLFMMAQAHLESHFATKGTAAKSNSIFNVGAFDGDSAEVQKKNGYGFDHPDFSIEPYLQLITTDYLVNGKTEQDLMVSFVNKNKKRYASYENYEATIKNLYVTMCNNKPLNDAYENYKMYRTKLGH
jgi:hypothetical protein